MKLLYVRSLARTLDALNEVFFAGRSLLRSEGVEVAKWIAGRQGKPGSYADMFAPTRTDYREGIRLFTGERIRSGAGTGHILGEEACRALILLNVPLVKVSDALSRATLGITKRLASSEASGAARGTFCCATCTCSLWRHLAAGGLNDSERRLASGMKTLKSHRLGDGRWKRFPFYYTLLALSETDIPSATAEMRYAAPACERSLRRSPRDDRFTRRRRLLAERILERC
jgi:hypothetical protein